MSDIYLNGQESTPLNLNTYVCQTNFFITPLQKITKKWPSFLLLGWMAVAPLTFSGLLAWRIVINEQSIHMWGFSQWLLAYVISMLTMAFALTPTTVIALVSGYFLGFNAILPLIASYSLASIIGYFVSKPLGKGFQHSLQSAYPKLDGFVHQMSDKSPAGFAFFCRISPVFPFAIMNVFLPFIGIKLRPFFWGGMAGMLPRTLLAIFVGNLASDVISLVKKPNSDNYMQIGFGMLLIISILGFVILFKRSSKVEG